jgi:predicted transcriptional regulator
MEKKRNKLEVIRDILLVIQSRNGRIRPTQILYKSNLSHVMMKEYLHEIISGGLVKEKHSPEGRTYSITEKGIKYLSEYKKVINFMESFGLSDNESAS